MCSFRLCPPQLKSLSYAPELPYGTTYLHLLRSASHCVLLNRLYYIILLIPHLIPNT